MPRRGQLNACFMDARRRYSLQQLFCAGLLDAASRPDIALSDSFPVLRIFALIAFVVAHVFAGLPVDLAIVLGATDAAVLRRLAEGFSCSLKFRTGSEASDAEMRSAMWAAR